MNECYHCGDDCGDDPIHFEDKNFCCNGCKMVYDIFSSNDLSYYYELQGAAGTTPKTIEGKYDFLDKAEIIDKLTEFNEDTLQIVNLYIPHVHCSSCIWVLENLNKLNPAVSHSQVDFPKKTVRITYNPKSVSLKNLVLLLTRIGYEPYISLDDFDNIKKPIDRSLIYKLGIAGFAFGNVMFLSFPEYLNMIGNETGASEFWLEQYKGLFRWLMFAFSLPVVFYSGQDYLISAYKGLRSKILNIDVPISLGILVLFIRSSFEIIFDWGSGFFDSLTGLVFFLLLGKFFQQKTYSFLSFERDYKSYFPIAVSRLVDGKEEFIPLKEIKVGDQIVVHNQELIPADGVLMKGEANVNYSFVTGESKPVFKLEGDELYAGGKQIGSTIVIEVVKEVMQSKLTQLWNQDFDSSSDKEKDLTSIIDVVSKYFTIVILAIALGAATYWFFHDTTKMIIAFTSVLIVACPCALALSIPFTYGNIMQLFGRIGFYLKKSQIVESLTHIDTVVFDKTGTITYIDAMNVNYHGQALNEQQKIWIKSLCRQSKHPLSVAVYEHIDGPIIDEIDDYMEIAASGIKGKIEGIKISMGSADFVGINKFDIQHKTSLVHISIGEQYLGYFAIANRYRDGIEELAKELKKQFNIHIISGDNDAERSRLQELFGMDTEMHFDQSPVEKLEYIKSLKEKGHKVLMVGDGLNDAGALNESYVGISIADDVFNFSPASDAILEAKQFMLLPDLIRYSHRALQIVYLSFAISFLYNTFGLGFAVSGHLSPIFAAILMPVSSVSVVAFVTIASRTALRKLKKYNTL